MKALTSLLALVQALALLQMTVGVLVIDALWTSGQSDVESGILVGGEPAVAMFQRWQAHHLRATIWCVVGFGAIVFLVAGLATLVWRRRPSSS